MNWKASKYQTFVCALQSECPEMKKKDPRKRPMFEVYFSNIII